VDDANADAPVFTAYKAYFSAAQDYLSAFAGSNAGALPDLNTFRRWAVGKLTELTGYQGVAPPVVRELDLAAAAAAGGH
jgi:hypothetical protein